MKTIKSINSRTKVLTPLLLATAIASGNASAAVLEEIVVTAQKREQSLQDVGIAVSAFTGDQMSQLGWDTADDVVSQAPGVTLVQPNGPGSFYINIRGVAQNDFSGDNQESPVAIYVDDVYVASPTGAAFQLFDFERVEILRGPQGTLFGRNATGGLVHYVTKRPEQEASGYVKATLGDYDQVDIEGAIGGGLTDSVSGRLSFSSNTHDGIIKNNAGSDLGDNDSWGARGQLLIELGESSELLLNVRAGELDNSNAPFDHSSARPGPLGLGVHFDGSDLSDDGGYNGWGNYADPDGGEILEGEYDADAYVKIETQGYTATFKTDVGEGLEFVSITDYNELERDYREDSDASPNPFFHFTLTSDMEQFSQEFRLSGETDNTSWVTGAYYMKYEGDLYTGGTAGGFARAAFGPLIGDQATLDALFPDEFGFDSPFSTQTESTAIFGQLEYSLSDSLTLTAGLRWSKEEKETEFIQYFSLFESTTSNEIATRDSLGIGPYWRYSDGTYSNLGAYVFEGGEGNPVVPLIEGEADTEIDDEFFTWKLGLDWQATEDTLLYLSYNRGIKAGGFNAPLDATLFSYGALTPDEFNFDKETLDAYEFGFKTELWDGRARLNGAIYYYDYQDYQAFNLESLTLFVFNTDAVNQGFELELQASPVEGMDVLLGMAYTDTKVEDAYSPDGGATLLDREMIMTPELTFNGMFRYEWELGGGSLAAQYDFSYMDEHFFQLKNSPVVEEDAYVISNIRFTYTTDEGDWMATAFVNNVTDEEYRQMALDLSGAPSAGGFGMTESAYGKPRWWGFSVTYNWN
ncbi:TonB-dependent receptor [Pseudomaricurvus alkylphenolicus]|uniref:TonB-dependent receptor n=1 Tax=Pseudomaricurvus alkylphenolicus TaxID=1306991 RepID=UPI00141EFCE3|nr:TonB-dependent receptor [Pseudomaricurvus alkylphenolicus]NIB40958.1 TonB-dependent receptor [Pseudomaricurvus alkylphenolicus]